MAVLVWMSIDISVNGSKNRNGSTFERATAAFGGFPAAVLPPSTAS
jgi:hypothetical protein